MGVMEFHERFLHTSPLQRGKLSGFLSYPSFVKRGEGRFILFGMILHFHVPRVLPPCWDMKDCPGVHLSASKERLQATRSPGSRPAKNASRLSRARNPMASRVSLVALPMWGIRKVFGSSRYPG